MTWTRRKVRRFLELHRADTSTNEIAHHFKIRRGEVSMLRRRLEQARDVGCYGEKATETYLTRWGPMPAVNHPNHAMP